MTKTLIGLLSLALVGTGGLVVAVDGFGGGKPARSVTLPGATTHGATTANGTSTERITTSGITTAAAEDVSGSCDEAEHVNDVRCTGVGDEDREDREDRSGPNSGSGSGDERSGHQGGSDADRRDDDSGHGSDDNDD